MLAALASDALADHAAAAAALEHALDTAEALDDRADGRPRAQLAAALSEREAAVLRFLPTMMSNQEIAGELFVSINTVKTHLKAIYRKLDVDDRREAVRRARDLALLGPL